MKAWLLIGLALMGCSPAAAEPKAPAVTLPLESIEFLGIEWSEPQDYRPTFMRAWSYTNATYPNVRVVDQRLPSGERHTRWTEARPGGNAKWVSHGVEVATEMKMEALTSHKTVTASCCATSPRPCRCSPIARSRVSRANEKTLPTGRFARHFLLGDERSHLTLAELSFDHVLWCNRHFGPRMRAVKVSSQAHLPLADASMTLCVALSVFTHIDDFESSWLAEINRVLEPGGYAYLTIQSEHTWQMLDRQPWLLTSLRDDPRFPANYSPEQPMPGERLVYDFMPGTRHHCCRTFTPH